MGEKVVDASGGIPDAEDSIGLGPDIDACVRLGDEDTASWLVCGVDVDAGSCPFVADVAGG